MDQQENQYPLLRGVPRENALFFTGHRPEKLPDGAKLNDLLTLLHLYTELAVRKGYTHFFTGLADGIDYYAAEYLFQLRRSCPSIRIIGVQPCDDYEAFFRRRGYSMPRLQYMLANADTVIRLPGSSWNPQVFLSRNRFMADHSGAVIAVCGNERSGSMQAFRYAQSQGLRYCRICLEREHEPSGWDAERSGF